MTTGYDDPRIGKLPLWAQDLIQQGYNAGRQVNHWRNECDRLRDQIDDLRKEHAREHARENGAAEYDTWTTTYTEGDAEIRFGLGTGQTIDFGPMGEVGSLFTATYRDGGLDIGTPGSEFTVKASFHESTLRIE